VVFVVRYLRVSNHNDDNNEKQEKQTPHLMVNVKFENPHIVTNGNGRNAMTIITFRRSAYFRESQSEYGRR
jgi:hypothetical protein